MNEVIKRDKSKGLDKKRIGRFQGYDKDGHVSILLDDYLFDEALKLLDNKI